MSGLFGWCLDSRHNLCRHQFTNGFGVTHVCDCACHHPREAASDDNQA